MYCFSLVKILVENWAKNLIKNLAVFYLDCRALAVLPGDELSVMVNITVGMRSSLLGAGKTDPPFIT